MNALDTARYIVAFLVLAGHPPSLLLWLVIHPFAASWRKLGPIWTYILLGVPVAGYMIGVWLIREPLLGRDLGANGITIVGASVSIVGAFLLNWQRRKQLNFEKLSGFPELSGEQYPGKLLTDGIYGRVRHPRYIEALLWVLGYALFANYLGAYLVLAFSLPVLYLVVILEERELRERFGTAYEEYCRRVPRFVPKRRLRQG
jgi:protein-S-isoprenylcysteine O-methyltransferase Ste14